MIERRQRLRTTRGLVGARGVGCTLEVAAPPASLGQVGHGLAIEGAGAGHLLQGGTGEGEQAAAEMETSQTRVCRAHQRGRLVVGGPGRWDQRAGQRRRRWCRHGWSRGGEAGGRVASRHLRAGGSDSRPGRSRH